MKWRSALLVAAVLMLGASAFAAETGGQLDDCIHLSIGNITARPGEDIMVPIYISETTGWGIMAFEGTICWCDLPAGLLQFIECSPGDVVLNSGWPMGFCGPCAPNCMTFASAGVTPLVGKGVLLYLHFHVSANAKPCMCCELTFEEMLLYDPENPLNVCLEGGEVCIEHCDIFGCLKMWYCDYDCGEIYWWRPLPGARIHLSQCGQAIATTYTGSEGCFAFECLEPHGSQQLTGGDGCPYCVEVDYCAAPDRIITAFDAALILRYLVCLDNLDCCSFCGCGNMVYPQQIAADVNCTGAITAYDASLILQYVVHILPAFPCPDPWVWINLMCDWCTYDCPGYFDIIGIYKGDVSGMCYCPAGDALTASSATIKIGIPQHHNGYVDVPVLVDGAQDICAVQFELDYNHAALAFDSVRPAALTEGFLSDAFETDGVLTVAMAGAESFDGKGRVAVVRFLKKDGPVPVVSTRVSIESALLNETEPVIQGHSYDAEVVGFALGPVSPNPTSEGTAISFSAPKAANVSLAIYNVNGQLVRTLHDGQVDSGNHRFAWDGTDSNGARVARGVYFCRMNADEFSATEKVVLLK
ncbi:MAG: FlgD immunoglobulin-like domain containing protein [bacterium]